MSEHLSSAAQDKRPTLKFGENGTFIEAGSEETDAYHHQKIGRAELGFEDFDPQHDRDSARMTAAAKLEEALLDLDERRTGGDEKAEVEAALETVTTIEPDKEANLSRIGVAVREVERLERWVRTFTESADKRLDAAVARLNSARLVVDVLTAAENEQTTINLKHNSDIDAQIAKKDAHNGLVRRNRHRRNNLKGAA
ncbi:hypothetical protein H7Y29_00525 [Microbacteriaceae bacterium]|nr:hypothetical protein [Candidatus Saccharibacteria bacterium]